MEKLIELLNERMKEEEKIGPKHSRFLNYDGINHVFRLNNGCSFCTELVLSKRYGFIKWLVENDKIDTDHIRTRVKRVYVELEPREFTPQDFTDRVIMLLSISDKPIEDLLLYLK